MHPKFVKDVSAHAHQHSGGEIDQHAVIETALKMIDAAKAGAVEVVALETMEIARKGEPKRFGIYVEVEPK